MKKESKCWMEKDRCNDCPVDYPEKECANYKTYITNGPKRYKIAELEKKVISLESVLKQTINSLDTYLGPYVGPGTGKLDLIILRDELKRILWESVNSA